MAITTAANIISTVSNHGLSAEQIKAADIEATEWNRIRTAVGVDAYETIVADAGTTYDDLYGYLQKALSYFVMADVIERINTEISDRGLFELRAENSSKAGPQSVEGVKLEFMSAGNSYLSMAVDWMVENDFTDYTNNMTEVAQDYVYPFASGNLKRNTRL